jgi:hypothetical protein
MLLLDVTRFSTKLPWPEIRQIILKVLKMKFYNKFFSPVFYLSAGALWIFSGFKCAASKWKNKPQTNITTFDLYLLSRHNVILVWQYKRWERTDIGLLQKVSDCCASWPCFFSLEAFTSFQALFTSFPSFILFDNIYWCKVLCFVCVGKVVYLPSLLFCL